MTLRKQLLAAASCCALTCLGAPGLAVAQTATAPSATTLEDLVVTANRRVERLQEVPVAVSAVSGETALRQGLLTTEQLSTGVPSLVYNRQANAATPFLRGVGNPSGLAGQEATVATYVDGVYIEAPTANLFSFNNIDRVEVLKGPQGTLFGRNATGGVIQIITRKPQQTPRLEANVGYANFDTYSGSVYMTGGLAENLAADLAMIGSNQRDGWGKALTTGQDTFKEESFAIRSKLLWTPTDATSVTLAADTGFLKTQMGINYHIVEGSLGPGGYTYAGFYNTLSNPQDVMKTRQSGVSGTLNHDFGGARLVSITSYRDARSHYPQDQDATPLTIVAANINLKSRSFSQEVQLLSAAESPVQWIVGAYYLDSTARYLPVGLTGAAFGGANIGIFGRQTTKSYSGFGQATGEIFRDTNLTLGLRYTSDRRAVAGYTLVNGADVGGSSQRDTFSKLTWRATLDHRFTPDILGYVSYNRGFKSGIFNTLAFADPAVRPEVLDAYEIGLKTETADRRLRLNLAAFYYDYRDIQVNKAVAGATLLLNAASATIKGLEIEAAARPVEGLTITAGAAILDGQYDRFIDAPFQVPVAGGGNIQAGSPATCPPGHPFTGAGCDASGNRTVRTPKFTANIGAEYRFETASGTYDVNLNAYHNSGFAWDPDNRLRQSAYNLLNGSVGWETVGGRWTVRLWAQNLTDEAYAAFAIAEGPGDHESPAAPRTFGIKLGMRLGGE